MARHFSGSTSSFLHIADTFPAVGYSVSMWIRTTDFTGGGCQYFKGHDNAAFLWSADYSQPGPTGVGALTGVGASFVGAAAAMTMNLNAWYHLLMVYTAANKREIWVNGTFYGINTENVGHIYPQNGLVLGGLRLNAPSVYAPYIGDVADVALWGTLLDAADAAALASGTRPGGIKPGSLWGWWKLAEGGGLESEVSPGYPSFTMFGTVPSVPDPPALLSRTLFYEDTVREWLPYSRVNMAFALDDPLTRRMQAFLPFTEYLCDTIQDPLNPFTVSVPPTGYYWNYPEGGLYFNGGRFAYPPAVVPNPPMTISCWLKGVFGGNGVMWSMGQYGTWNSFYIGVGSAPAGVSAIRVANADFVGHSACATTSLLTATEWLHTVWIFNADMTIKVYANGRLEGQETKPSTPHYPFNWFQVASDPSTTNPGFGGMRDLRIWPVELSAPEVWELYSRGYAKTNGAVMPPRQFAMHLGLEEVIPPVVTSTHHHHHIIGAV